jgi:hypothetical protein
MGEIGLHSYCSQQSDLDERPKLLNNVKTDM